MNAIRRGAYLLVSAAMLAGCGEDGQPAPSDPGGGSAGADGDTPAPPNAPAPPDVDPSATDSWQTVISGAWELGPMTERYVCVRQTLERDYFFGAMRPINPLGTHHTVLTIGEPDGPDGVSDCTAGENNTLFLGGSGVGTNPLELPAGIAIKMEKGQQLLLNLHLFNVKDEPLTGTSGLQAKVRDEAEVEHVGHGILAGSLFIALPPGEETTVKGTCTMTEDVTLVAVAPHMHQLGIYMKVVAESSAAGDVVLSDAPYDFEAQLITLLDPVEMKKGDKLRVDCTYMNTTEKEVTFGDSSLQEMCFAGIWRYPILDEPFLCVQ